MDATEKFEKEIEKKRFVEEGILKDLSKDLGKEYSKGISDTQFRKFFDDVKIIQRKSDAGIEFEKLKPEIILMKAKAAREVARASREKKPMLEKFKRFIDKCVDEKLLGGGEKVYSEFTTFFEALYAYHYYYYHEQKGGRGQ
jgi:CRISPR type III-A-associated protein Csm2